MATQSVYVNELSYMDGKKIEYKITTCEKDNCEQYGIQVITDAKDYHEEDTVNAISPDKNFVEEIITYLYQNSIDTIHFKDVLEDYILQSEKVD